MSRARDVSNEVTPHCYSLLHFQSIDPSIPGTLLGREARPLSRSSLSLCYVARASSSDFFYFSLHVGLLGLRNTILCKDTIVKPP